MITCCSINFCTRRIPTIRHDPYGREDADDRNDNQKFYEWEAFIHEFSLAPKKVMNKKKENYEKQSGV